MDITASIDLTIYHIILVSTSAGKDSQAMLDLVFEMATEQGVADRVVAVHADLERAEWDGTLELAAEQAAHYKIPFISIKRPQGDLLDHIRERGMFPDTKNRWCTSDHKRDQVEKVVTGLHAEHRKVHGNEQFRVLDCIGFTLHEAANSPSRREKILAAKPTTMNTRWSTKPKKDGTRSRIVDTMYPIGHFTLEMVWDRIKASGVRYHEAYDLGMPRLSCVFCFYSSKKDLKIAGRANPELLQQYVQIEQDIDFTFTADLSLAQVQAEINSEALAA